MQRNPHKSKQKDQQLLTRHQHKNLSYHRTTQYFLKYFMSFPKHYDRYKIRTSKKAVIFIDSLNTVQGIQKVYPSQSILTKIKKNLNLQKTWTKSINHLDTITCRDNWQLWSWSNGKRWMYIGWTGSYCLNSLCFLKNYLIETKIKRW